MDTVRWPRFSGLYGTAIGFGLGIAATIVSAATPTLAASVLVVALVSAMTTVAGAIATALQTWLLYAGFVIGSTGQVAFTPDSGTVAVTLAVTAVAASGAGAVVRWVVRWVLRHRVVVVPVPRQAMGRMDYGRNVGVAP